MNAKTASTAIMITQKVMENSSSRMEHGRGQLVLVWKVPNHAICTCTAGPAEHRRKAKVYLSKSPMSLVPACLTFSFNYRMTEFTVSYTRVRVQKEYSHFSQSKCDPAKIHATTNNHENTNTFSLKSFRFPERDITRHAQLFKSAQP